MESQSETTQMVSALTLPVIVNGDSVSPVASASAGAEGPIPPKTAKQKDVKSLWEAIKSRFGDNKGSKMIQKTILKQTYEYFAALSQEGLDKTYDRFQKLISQIEIYGEVISQEDANMKLLRSLSAWSNITLIMRNKSDLDTLSMDDLYNYLKVYDSDIKSQSSSSSNSQNVAFVSSDNSSSTNETVNTAHSVSAASSKDQASIASYANDVMFSFFSNQSNALQLDNEDLKQIDTNNLEEIDLKWQVAMLTIRVKRFINRTGRKLDLNCKETVGFHKTKGNRNRDAPTRNVPVDTSTTNAIVVQDGIDKTGLGYDSQMNKSDLNDLHVNESDVLNKVVNGCESDGDNNQVNDRFKKDNSVFKSKVSETITSVAKIETNASKTNKDSLEKPKTVRPSAPLIEEYEPDSEDENVFKPKEVKKTVKPSLEKIEFINTRNTTVKNENIAEKPRKASTSVSVARRVNTAASRPNVNNTLPITYSYVKAHSPIRRPFNKKSKAKTNNFNEKVNNVTTVGPKAVVSVVEGNRNIAVCDKKNNVLFTDTKCVVLSSFFKLLDESQILLKNVVRVGGLTCLFSNATLDESSLWHKRLGHINFKTMNKLVRGNLVRGLPLKLFENDHTCVACQKGKQHKASCIENQIDHTVKTIRYDNGIEFKNRIMNEFCEIKGTKANINAGQAEKKTVPGPQYDPTKEGDNNDQEKHLRDQEEALRKQCEQEFKRLYGQGEAANTNSTNRLNTVSSPVNAVSSSFTIVDPGREKAQRNKFESVFGQDKDANGNRMFTPVSVTGSTYVNLGGSIPVNAATLPPPTDPLMPDLEDTVDLQDTGILSCAYDDEVKGKVADFSNLELTTVVYRNKKDERGIVVTNKARLVAQGYTQEEGIDYDEIFAPVARIEAIMLFLAYASFMGFIVYQLDVKSAFLYGTIEEEVYVFQPPSFEDPHFPDKVYKVEKALYGPHQAPRAWYETLSTYLLEKRFRRGIIDKTLFIKKCKGNLLLMHVYVDDIIFGSTKKSLCTEFEELMHKKFQMSSMGKLTFFLGLQVTQRDDGIFISQDKYVADILKKFNFFSVKTTSTLIETNKALLKDEEAEDVDVHLYRSMIGSLMYLTASRPDIIFVVCTCARFQVTPKVLHLHFVKRIFRYLKGQPKLGLWYPKDSPFDLEAFSDSDYAGASLDRISIIGVCQFLRKRLIS
nr:putative ribonuclease H-like domain-containing protein [Tanacetum cinerariifolium]